MITPPTFAARPINGGDLMKNPIIPPGKWAFTPKLNGWRTLVHIPTGTMFNRHGDPLSIAGEFDKALGCIKATLDCEAFKWADCEALDRRHGIGRGCLVLLDVVPEPCGAAVSWLERRRWIESPIVEALELEPPWTTLTYCPPWCNAEGFPYLSLVPTLTGNRAAWESLKQVNTRLGCEFYEGMVAWNTAAPYPIQLRSDSAESAALIKYRWKH